MTAEADQRPVPPAAVDTPPTLATSSGPVEHAVLDEIQRRVLWLATRMVDAANRERDTGDGVKVGGHQASSASLVTIMTALWFAHLDPEDRVSVKPHASPVFHAVQYLLGRLDRTYLTMLRQRGGLQSYPSRTKDPDGVDFSTGSVGLGAAAPLFAAAVRRYVDAHFGPRPRTRWIALIGDAELDEGNVWEAVADPVSRGLGDVTWIVDFNRQSLDRVVPGVRIDEWRRSFEAYGWHVQEVKYGRRLREFFARPGGGAVRRWLDLMPNEQYQSLFGLPPAQVRDRFLDDAPAEVGELLAQVPAEELAALVTDLGGHDLGEVLRALAACDEVADRPSVVFAYTVKGWGLPIAGNPRNHSALLTGEQVAELRRGYGLDEASEWDRLEEESAAGRWAARRAEHLHREPRRSALEVTVPASTGVRTGRAVSTQEVFGRVLVDLSRSAVAPYLVTTAPDVATSTNLAGFINRMAVFAPAQRRAWSVDPLLKWAEGPTGQHLELGISEMNLFLLLGQLGLSWDLSEQPLLPVGTVYDPFVCRGLDAFIYSAYSGARFLVAGTPSGITLAPEGGAHQSTVTASLGLELPGVTAVEPAYAVALDWLLCDALGRIARGEPGAYYARLSTRPVDQAPFEAARARLGDAELRRQVLAGAYRLVEADLHQLGPDAPVVHLAAAGAVLPEVVAAAAELAEEGVAAHVVDVTSADRLYAAWSGALRQGLRTATAPRWPAVLTAAFGVPAPVVTVHDAASHALAWLGSALGVPCVPLGVDDFGQSGSVPELYELHDLLPGSIVNAALAALTVAG
jgi:pyruvate dehydrogenase E1 component